MNLIFNSKVKFKVIFKLILKPKHNNLLFYKGEKAYLSKLS